MSRSVESPEPQLPDTAEHPAADGAVRAVATTDTVMIQTANTPTGQYDVNRPLPYPYYAEPETGDILRQDVWKGDPERILGFQRTVETQKVDLLWRDAAAEPERAVGMYPVMLATGGRIYTITRPVSGAEAMNR